MKRLFILYNKKCPWKYWDVSSYTRMMCTDRCFFFFFQKRDYGVPEGRFAQSQYLEIISRYCILWLAPERGKGESTHPSGYWHWAFQPTFPTVLPSQRTSIGICLWDQFVLEIIIIVVFVGGGAAACSCSSYCSWMDYKLYYNIHKVVDYSCFW